jgi:CspA family cold shock protein
MELDGKRAAAVATGRVLQFDEERGYGFIAADDGGEDVFLHASVFDGDSRQLVPGLPVEFETMAGDRGRKAFGVHVLKTNRTPALGSEQAGDEDEGLCDVLSETRFGHEITEILLDAAPDMTGKHIVQVRQNMIAFGRKHGWIDS